MNVYKFVLRPKIFSAGSLTKSYAKERSPPHLLKKVSLTGHLCALAAGVNVRQHLGICEQRSKKKQRS